MFHVYLIHSFIYFANVSLCSIETSSIGLGYHAIAALTFCRQLRMEIDCLESSGGPAGRIKITLGFLFWVLSILGVCSG